MRSGSAPSCQVPDDWDTSGASWSAAAATAGIPLAKQIIEKQFSSWSLSRLCFRTDRTLVVPSLPPQCHVFIVRTCPYRLCKVHQSAYSLTGAYFHLSGLPHAKAGPAAAKAQRPAAAATTALPSAHRQDTAPCQCPETRSPCVRNCPASRAEGRITGPDSERDGGRAGQAASSRSPRVRTSRSPPPARPTAPAPPAPDPAPLPTTTPRALPQPPPAATPPQPAPRRPRAQSAASRAAAAAAGGIGPPSESAAPLQGIRASGAAGRAGAVLLAQPAGPARYPGLLLPPRRAPPPAAPARARCHASWSARCVAPPPLSPSPSVRCDRATSPPGPAAPGRRTS